jgi:cbb3-type cytochrome oxidase subunit 3
MGLLFVLLLVMILLALVPAWPYSRSWGYGPSGLASALLIILIVLLLIGYVPWGFQPVVVHTP